MTLQHPHAELSAYIDGALEMAAKAAVDGHLVACALCRAHVAELRVTTAFVQALPDPIPSRSLVPRLATPAWLAPLRTLMTLASGAAVFLFIASALVNNITFLASGGGAGATALEAARDRGANAPAAAQPANLPVPAPSPGAAFSVASPSVDSRTALGRADATPSDAKVLQDQATAAQSTAAPSAAAELAAAPPVVERFGFSEPQRSSLLNPWLWLALAITSGAIAIALQRRLRRSI